MDELLAYLLGKKRGGGSSGGGEAEATLAAMIDGSITEITSNAKQIAASAFRSRSALTSVKFPNAPKVVDEAFFGCKALTRADFSSVTSFGAYAFYNTALTALVLRGNDVPHISSASIFNGTPIKSGRGYIYVPSELLYFYQTEPGWSDLSPDTYRGLEYYTVDGTITGELDESKI